MKKKEEELLSKIPEQIQVSMFMINCKDIRQIYAQKYRQIVEKEIKLIARKAKERTLELSTKFRMKEDAILKVPTTIDELTEIKTMIQEGGTEIEKLKVDIEDCMDYYKILDEFVYELSSADQTGKWELYGAPQRLVKVMENQSLVLDKLKEQMIKEMELDQEEFEEHIANLELTIGGFDSNKRLDKFEEVADAVDNIDAKIIECIEKARVFTQREYLVGKP